MEIFRILDFVDSDIFGRFLLRNSDLFDINKFTLPKLGSEHLTPIATLALVCIEILYLKLIVSYITKSQKRASNQKINGNNVPNIQ